MPDPRRRSPRRLAGGLARDDAGVAEVLGAAILIGMTVLTVGVLAALVLSYDGPSDRAHVDLEVSVAAGAGGWGSGDESIRVRHLGGEALDRDDTTVRYFVNGVATTVSGSALGSAFADGQLTIGETWVRSQNLAANDELQVQVVEDEAQSRVLAAATIVPGLTAGGPSCALDTTPPSVQNWTVPNVSTTTVGSVQVTAKLTDDCSGISPAMPAPNLETCITPGTAWTSAGAMSNVGTYQWQRSITGVTWSLLGGETLRTRLNPVVDTAPVPNTGPTGSNAELIDGLTVYTYVGGATPGIGSVSGLSSAQASCDSGALATLAEGTAAASVRSGGSTAGSSSVSSPDNALVDDNANQAVLNGGSDTLDVSGFTMPPDATAIRQVVIGFEGKKVSGTGDPAATLSYLVNATAGATSQSFTVSGTSNEQEFTKDVTADRAWSVGEIPFLKVRVLRTSPDSGFQDLQVDHAYATVTYATASGTAYTARIDLTWSGVPNAATQRLEASYRVTSPGDTFTVQAWQGGNTWRTCAGSLSSTTLATFTCDLVVASEYQGGAPRIRVLDATPQGASQGTLFLEHARVRSL